jgi:hypothetical protein
MDDERLDTALKQIDFTIAINVGLGRHHNDLVGPIGGSEIGHAVVIPSVEFHYDPGVRMEVVDGDVTDLGFLCPSAAGSTRPKLVPKSPAGLIKPLPSDLTVNLAPHGNTSLSLPLSIDLHAPTS